MVTARLEIKKIALVFLFVFSLELVADDPDSNATNPTSDGCSTALENPPQTVAFRIRNLFPLGVSSKYSGKGQISKEYFHRLMLKLFGPENMNASMVIYNPELGSLTLNFGQARSFSVDQDSNVAYGIWIDTTTENYNKLKIGFQSQNGVLELYFNQDGTSDFDLVAVQHAFKVSLLPFGLLRTFKDPAFMGGKGGFLKMKNMMSSEWEGFNEAKASSQDVYGASPKWIVGPFNGLFSIRL